MQVYITTMTLRESTMVNPAEKAGSQPESGPELI